MKKELKYGKIISLRLSAKEYEQLHKLATQEETSASQVIRTLIANKN